jgi:hypothetical protein
VQKVLPPKADPEAAIAAAAKQKMEALRLKKEREAAALIEKEENELAMLPVKEK